MRLLDLFCGVGGAAMGYHLAGFEVVGVDIKAQPYFPFEFVQADAISYPLDSFDVIHASPPCQAHTTLRHLHKDRQYPCLLETTRLKLQKSGKPYVIENVMGAPLLNPIILCGSMFDLKVRRHRKFESNMPLCSLSCQHKQQGRPIDVSGTGGRRVGKRLDGKGGDSNKPRNLREAQEAMGMPWANRYGISQAIPPAYTQFIGTQILLLS
jgi:DNA (cytosine-5)-methyltransferase 1